MLNWAGAEQSGDWLAEAVRTAPSVGSPENSDYAGGQADEEQASGEGGIAGGVRCTTQLRAAEA